jgi:hypothetical protein
VRGAAVRGELAIVEGFAGVVHRERGVGRVIAERPLRAASGLRGEHARLLLALEGDDQPPRARLVIPGAVLFDPRFL